MKAEKKEIKIEKDRKNYYAGITVLLSTAQENLSDYSFLTLANSVRAYIDRLVIETKGVGHNECK